VGYVGLRKVLPRESTRLAALDASPRFSTASKWVSILANRSSLSPISNKNHPWNTVSAPYLHIMNVHDTVL
jgi:hypothetical protein